MKDVIGPQPGDVGVPGQIIWCTEMPIFRACLGTPWFAGAVRASAEVYGFVAADVPDPLRFQFWSSVGFDVGESVQFDVIALPYGPAATNLAPLLTLEDHGELLARHLAKAGEHETAARLRDMAENLYWF